MELIKLKCKSCGAILNINPELNEIVCNYCGTKMLIDDEATELERIEKVKLNALKDKHDFNMKAKIDKINMIKDLWNKKVERDKKAAIIVGIIMGAFFFAAIIIGIISDKKNPSLSSYNSLNMGMSYTECREVLGSEGHLVVEEDARTVYEWYDVYCHETENSYVGGELVELKKECPAIIKLEFLNNKLVNRSEKGLK